MFFKDKKSQVDWPIVTLGVIALLIVFSFVIFLWFITQSRLRDVSINNEGSSLFQIAQPISLTPEEIKEDYKIGMEDVLRIVRSRDVDQLQYIESQLFSLRVPQDKLDKHFLAAVSVRSFRDGSSDISSSDLWSELDDIIVLLIK